MRFTALFVTLLGLAALPAPAADPGWVAPMREVHAKFTGTPGTLALFGDSITHSLAFWAPLESAPKTLPEEDAKALAVVRGHMKAECWRVWRGPDYGNQSATTIRWADENVGKWLQKLNPEAAVLMFGTNDLTQPDAREYEAKTRAVVDRCLKNGTVVILTTIPPRSGRLAQAKTFADVQRRLAAVYQLPLVDFQAEILRRRPADWDGSLPQFKEYAADGYQVPTLIAGDGVHPSNPAKHADYSPAALDRNGFQLRTVLTLRAYADVVRQVLAAKR
ncbi:MAG TPA: SGNH/GDSL hydrolase family protein [Urbifossiella sp.]|jgi:lysophospholipase L1-like esterase|nr:SGNH/GDSL hydrolase family protein [Urbifossiella sp.]